MRTQRGEILAWLTVLTWLGTSVLGTAQITINYQAALNQRDVVDSSGFEVANGNEVRLGYFVDGFDIGANAGNLLTLGSNWRQFDSTQITTFADQAGRFSDSATVNDSQFDGKKAHFWIFRTQANDAPAADYSNVLDYSLFTSTATHWKFPASGSTPGSYTDTLTSDQVDVAYFGSFSDAVPYGSLHLGAVPEPEEFALVMALAALGYGVYFRQRQKRGLARR